LIFLRFRFVSFTFVVFRSGCFWCETGAGLLIDGNANRDVPRMSDCFEGSIKD
jgi:hypothetical protein